MKKSRLHIAILLGTVAAVVLPTVALAQWNPQAGTAPGSRAPMSSAVANRIGWASSSMSQRHANRLPRTGNPPQPISYYEHRPTSAALNRPKRITNDPNGQNGVTSYTYDRIGNRLHMGSTVPNMPAIVDYEYDDNDRMTTETREPRDNWRS